VQPDVNVWKELLPIVIELQELRSGIESGRAGRSRFGIGTEVGTVTFVSASGRGSDVLGAGKNGTLENGALSSIALDPEVH
jgi:hypothetical protein